VFSPSRLTDTPAPLPTAPQPRRAAVILPSATPLPPTAAPTPTREPAAFINRQRARVVRVWDGQSILIDNGLTVRYLGLQAPGAGVLNRAAQPFGREAAQRNAELVEGKEVDLEQDVTDVDANGQLPRYVYVDGLFVNEDIVLAGLANAAPRPPDVRHQDQLNDAEREARDNRRGIWMNAPTLTLTPRAAPRPPAAPAVRPTAGLTTSTPGPSPTRAPSAVGTPAAGASPPVAGTVVPVASLVVTGTPGAGATPPPRTTVPTTAPAVPAASSPAPAATVAPAVVPTSGAPAPTRALPPIPRFGEGSPPTPAARPDGSANGGP